MKSLILAASLAGLVASAGAAQSHDASSQTLKPLHGVSFNAGDNNAVSYFTNDDGRCNLVVVFAKEPDWANPGVFAPTKVETAVPANEATRVTAAGGKAFEFRCAADAQSMQFQGVQQIAYSAQ
jgi:hypothetical protein